MVIALADNFARVVPGHPSGLGGKAQRHGWIVRSWFVGAVIFRRFAFEPFVGDGDRTDTVESEGAKVVGVAAERRDVPVSLIAEDVKRLDRALPDLITAERVIGELHRPALLHGRSQYAPSVAWIVAKTDIDD